MRHSLKYFRMYTNVLNLHVIDFIMDGTTIQKKVQSYRLPVDLTEILKQMARRENRRLNNNFESVLLNVAYNEPNEESHP